MFYEPKKKYPFEIDPLNALVFPRPLAGFPVYHQKEHSILPHILFLML